MYKYSLDRRPFRRSEEQATTEDRVFRILGVIYRKIAPCGKTRKAYRRGPRQGCQEYRITCSFGFATNLHLAKIACAVDKPNGLTIWHPAIIPAPLLAVPMDAILGVGNRMKGDSAKRGYSRRKTCMKPNPNSFTHCGGALPVLKRHLSKLESIVQI